MFLLFGFGKRLKGRLVTIKYNRLFTQVNGFKNVNLKYKKRALNEVMECGE